MLHKSFGVFFQKKKKTRAARLGAPLGGGGRYRHRWRGGGMVDTGTAGGRGAFFKCSKSRNFDNIQYLESIHLNIPNATSPKSRNFQNFKIHVFF